MGEPTIHLCTAADVGMAETFMCCGGWVYAEGNTVPIPGSSPTLQYCSQDCHDDWEGVLADEAEQRRKRKEFYDGEDALYAAALNDDGLALPWDAALSDEGGDDAAPV